MNCVCVKAGHPCSNCLPSRKGNCMNLQLANLSSTPQSPPFPQVPTKATKSGPPLSPNNGLQGSPSTNNRSQGSPSPNNGSQGLLFDLANHRSEESSNYANIPALPAFSELAPPQFTWGEEDPEVFIHSISVAFDEVVHWRRNIFSVPCGNAGKGFVSELSHLFRAYAEGSALESIALKASTVMSALLLQKPHSSSKSRRSHHMSGKKTP